MTVVESILYKVKCSGQLEFTHTRPTGIHTHRRTHTHTKSHKAYTKANHFSFSFLFEHSFLKRPFQADRKMSGF